MDREWSGDSARRSARVFWALLAVLLLLAAFAAASYRPTPARDASAPASVFSARRAAADWQSLAGGNVPHPVGSAMHETLHAALFAKLTSLGLSPELQTGWACDDVYRCGYSTNIVAHVPGSEPGGDAVLMAAHYDSVAAGPGAGDDGSGVAVILESVRALLQGPRGRHDLIVLIDDGEEQGLFGARLFVARHPEAARVRAVVNLDARGDSGPSLMFETGSAVHWALSTWSGSASRPISNSLYFFIYKLLPNDTDFTVFKAAGYQGVNFAFIGDVERYHTELDSAANLDPATLQHQGDNALAAVRAFTNADFRQATPSRAVFVDVFGHGLLIWSAKVARALAVLIALALGFGLVRIAARSRLGVVAILRALLAQLGGWLGAAALAAGVLWLLRSLGAVPGPRSYGWIAHPGPMLLASVAFGLLAPAFATLFLPRRQSSLSHWLAQCVLMLAALLATSFWMPELSFLFLLPALLATLALSAWMTNPQGGESAPTIAIMLPVIGTALVLVPSLLFTYPALGVTAWPVIAACTGWLALGAAPLLDASLPRTRAILIYGVLTVAVAGIAATLLARTYDNRLPQRTSLWYLGGVGETGPGWFLRTDSGRLPGGLSPAHGFAPASEADVRAGLRGFRAPAPTLDLPAPQASLIANTDEGASSRWQLRLASARAAPELLFGVPDDCSPSDFAVLDGGQRLPVEALHWAGARWLLLTGAPDHVVQLELRLHRPADGKPVQLRLWDRSFGLPASGARLRNGWIATVQSQDGDLTILRTEHAF